MCIHLRPPLLLDRDVRGRGEPEAVLVVRAARSPRSLPFVFFLSVVLPIYFERMCGGGGAGGGGGLLSVSQAKNAKALRFEACPAADRGQ